MNWWDTLTDEQIEELKNNKVGSGLEPLWMQAVFCQIMDRSLEWWNFEGALWLSTYSYDTLHVYRLSPAWERPEVTEERPELQVSEYLRGVSDDAGSKLDEEVVDGGCQECWESGPGKAIKASDKKFLDEFYDARRDERRWEMFKMFAREDPAADYERADYELLVQQADEALAAYYNDKEGAE